MTDVETISGSPLGSGDAVRRPERLEQRGLIEALEPDERRRPYRLTSLGATTLRAQLEHMQGFTRTALERLGQAAVTARSDGIAERRRTTWRRSHGRSSRRCPGPRCGLVARAWDRRGCRGGS